MQIKLLKRITIAAGVFTLLTAVTPILHASGNAKSCLSLFSSSFTTPGIKLMATSEGPRSYSSLAKVSKDGKMLVTIGFGNGPTSQSRLTIQNIQTGHSFTQTVQSIETFDVTNTSVIIKPSKGRRLDVYDLQEPNTKTSYDLPLKKGETDLGSAVAQIRSQKESGLVGVKLASTLFVQSLHQNQNLIRIENVEGFEWHPTLPILAYTVREGNVTQLRVLDFVSQAARALVSDTNLDLGRFSPDGAKITYLKGGHDSTSIGVIEFLATGQIKTIEGNLNLSSQISQGISINWISPDSFIIQPQRTSRFLQLDVSNGRLDPIEFKATAVSRQRNRNSVSVYPGEMAMLATNDGPIYLAFYRPSVSKDAEIYFYIGNQMKHFSINKMLRQLIESPDQAEETKTRLRDTLFILENFEPSSVTVLGARDKHNILLDFGKATIKIDFDSLP